MRLTVAFVVVVLTAAGCVSTDAPATDDARAVGDLQTLTVGASTLTAFGLRSNYSAITNPGLTDAAVTFPEGVLVLADGGRLLATGTDGVEIPAGAQVEFVPPWGAESIDITITAGGETATVPLRLDEGPAAFSGDLAVDLMQVQNDHFPHRRPGHENHQRAIDYFAAWFEALGYEVEVNTYPDQNLPDPRATSPNSFASVVAWKHGPSSRIIGIGGHFDVVEQTTHGAFDNTAGTVATMALAQAFAPIITDHTMMFALWSGEEDGILGSQAWVSANPDKVRLFDSYLNYDVTGLSYPAPAGEPAGIVVAAGPDRAIGDKLHADHALIETAYLQSGATFIYEGVAEGQATGAGVNAQSDHTPFMARGVPVYFQFTENVNDVFAIIHSETDTLENLTKYAVHGVEGFGQDLTADERALGRALLADSFEVQMGLGYYYALLLDAGVITSARPER